MKQVKLKEVKKGDYFKLSNKPNAKIYEKFSGVNTKTTRYGWVEDISDEQFTKNGNRLVFIDIEY